MPQIWFRHSKHAWYLQTDRRRQKRLGRTKKEAEAAHRDWLLEQGEQLPEPARKKLTVAELARLFLADALAHTKPKSYEFYRYFVEPFAARFPAA
jgi:hypothetical protein